MILRTVLFAFLIALEVQASIQYPGGTIVNTTFVTTTGTRQEIVTGIQTGLTTAGWSVISGGGTGNVIMQSASTPDTRQIQTNLIDPGAGNCAQVKMRNVAGTKISQAYYLLPAALKTFRIIANKYQFFVFTPGTSAAREFMAMGVPYIPTFLQSGGSAITGDQGWIQGNANSDVQANIFASFRTFLASGDSSAGATSSYSSVLVNGSLLDISIVNGTSGIGTMTLITAAPAGLGNAGANLTTKGYRWFDSSIQMIDALMAAGIASINDEAKINGQLWGALIAVDSFVADSTITFDGHTFFAVTGGNSGNVSGSSQAGMQLKGTLFIAVN